MQQERVRVETDDHRYEGALWLSPSSAEIEDLLSIDLEPGWRPSTEDWYVVIDEHVEDSVGVVIAEGRLVFTRKIDSS